MVRFFVLIALTFFADVSCRHGPVAKCPTSQAETVVLEYLASAEGSVQRRTMERQFGKTTLAKLVATYREEQENKKWLKSFTMACPGCDVNVEKSLGCNHVSAESLIQVNRLTLILDDLCQV